MKRAMKRLRFGRRCLSGLPGVGMPTSHMPTQSRGHGTRHTGGQATSGTPLVIVMGSEDPCIRMHGYEGEWSLHDSFADGLAGDSDRRVLVRTALVDKPPVAPGRCLEWPCCQSTCPRKAVGMAPAAHPCKAATGGRGLADMYRVTHSDRDQRSRLYIGAESVGMARDYDYEHEGGDGWSTGRAAGAGDSVEHLTGGPLADGLQAGCQFVQG